MIYLIFGNQTPSIKSRIRALTKDKLPQTDEMNFVKYDGSNSLIQEYIDEANYVPLGYDFKAVVVDNCYYLLKPRPRNKIESEQDYKALFDYIKHPNPDCDLILTVPSSSVDKNSDIYKLINEKGKVFEIVDPDQTSWKEYTKQTIARYIEKNPGFSMDRDALAELTERTNGDVALFKNSVTKLFLYTNHVTSDDVLLMVTRPLDDNAFEIYNSLMQKRPQNTVKIFRDLRVNNVEPVTLIGMLANQFRLLNQVAFLAKKSTDNDTIAKELGIKPIRAQIIRRQIYLLSEKRLHEVLDELYQLDLQIKSGQIYDRYYAFELFLINFKVS